MTINLEKDILTDIDRMVFDKVRKAKPIGFHRVLSDILEKYNYTKELTFFGGSIVTRKMELSLSNKLGYTKDMNINIKNKNSALI